jgi:hypothetical protein
MTTLVLEHLQHADSASPDITIDSSGRIGIGTNTPGSTLNVVGSGRFDNSAATPVRLHINNSGSNDYASIYADTASAYKNLVINPNGGNVGIGTTSPSARLDVVSNSASGYVAEFRESNASNFGTIVIDSPTDGESRPSYMDYATGGTVKWSTGLAYLDTARSFHIGTGSGTSNSKVTITTGGNVGIGTTTPTEHLEIKTSSPALKITDTANSNNNIKISQGYNSYLTASNNIYMSASGHSDMLNLINGAVQVKKTRTGAISGGASDTGAVIKLHTEAQWESGYGNNALATTNDYLGGIEFHTGDGSTGEGLRAAIRGTVDSYYNQNSIVFETAVGATAAEPIERMRVWHNGQVTMPYQPCFGAILGAHIYTSNYLTGWTAQTNVGSHFNAGDGTFTAPVTGQYYFYVSVMRSTNDSGDYSVQIRKNGSVVRLSNDMVNGSYVTYMQTTVPAVLTLAANDNIRFYIGNTVTTSYAYQGTYTHCGGYLIG